MTKPGTPEEAFSDSVMINARNIKNLEILEQAAAVANDPDTTNSGD